MKNKRIIKIGYKESCVKKILESDIIKFANISGDFNPIHLDKEYAKNSIFKKRIAHGLYVGSFISRLIGEKIPGVGTIYLYQSLNFLEPVFINDIITTYVEVIEFINLKKVKLKTTCLNQNYQEVIKGEALVYPPPEVEIVD